MGKYLVSIGGHLFNPIGSKPSSNEETNGITVNKPLLAERMLCLDTRTLEWSKVGNVGSVPDNTYGHSINTASDHLIIFGGKCKLANLRRSEKWVLGWSNRAQNELYVGKVSGEIAASVEHMAKLAETETEESKE